MRLPSLSTPTLRHAQQLAGRLSASLETLSSGNRISRAQHDAAGLAIAEAMRAQVIGKSQAGRNIQDSLSVLRIGIDGVQGVIGPLQRIRELAVQAANGVYGAAERQAMQAEVDSVKQLVVTAYQLAQESNLDISLPTGSRILDFQIGANEGETLRLDYTGLRDTMFKFLGPAYGYTELYNSPLNGTLAFALGGFAPPPNPLMQTLVPKVMDLTVPGGPARTIQLIDETLNGAPAQGFPLPLPATKGLLGELANLAAVYNRLEHAYTTVMTGEETHAAAESRIRDADMAEAFAAFTRHQVQQSASIAMVAQANVQAVQVTRLIVEATARADA